MIRGEDDKRRRGRETKSLLKRNGSKESASVI
jgi:hypothetical protein